MPECFSERSIRSLFLDTEKTARFEGVLLALRGGFFEAVPAGETLTVRGTSAIAWLVRLLATALQANLRPNRTKGVGRKLLPA